MSAIVIEDQPLIRLGMQCMLEQIPGIVEVRAMDLNAINYLAPGLLPTLVLFGMSDEEDNWSLLRELHRRMPNASVVVLSDNMWLRLSTDVNSYGVVDVLPKCASIQQIERVVSRLLGNGGYLPISPGRRLLCV